MLSEERQSYGNGGRSDKRCDLFRKVLRLDYYYIRKYPRGIESFILGLRSVPYIKVKSNVETDTEVTMTQVE